MARQKPMASIGAVRNMAVAAAVVFGCSTSAALAVPTFFVAPNAHPATSSTLDTAWQAAVGGFTEFNFDAFANGSTVSALTAGSLGISIGLQSPGNASGAEIFFGAYAGGGGILGTVSGGALLNRNAGSQYGEMTFGFSSPVQGFGAWIFDNNLSTPESFQLSVTEADTAVTTSAILESGNGLPHFVEGFIGVTSLLGITDVSIQLLDGTTGNRVNNRFFEVDHVQVATAIAEPGTLALFGLGLAGLGFARRRKAA
jgi:hypothetical protein